ncbi:NAD(P)/FAD-dependent oxidoreductase [Phytoactinopolyspora halotolerans]|uniref:FAD-dependent oxidoreductase n=1 Tax=Phytoactinopolyspora halotolerans TaxID=1981512 RepID=A0A6L9S6M0_9ACTN|nr:FAD-dependent oxidoreductase [Phytoactinopolyspora halotolerans]NEE00613.1 FAD-dependent oxidoreductase [Phytoactinopolyspora halotolerans]
MRKRVLVLGGNFGGLTAALSVKHELQGDVDVRVIAASDRFLFNPSLIWLPFGKRRPQDITFPLAPTLTEHDVDFVHASATRIDAAAKRVTAAGVEYDYDYLVIATGYRNAMGAVPGLADTDGAYTITTLEDAIHAGEGWRRFLQNPGPVIVGASQGAGCFGAAYEFLFNMSYQLRRFGLKKHVPLTYVTAEPFLGHFGIGGLPGGERLLGMFLRKEGITAVTEVAMEEVVEGKLAVSGREPLDFAYAVIIPPFEGQDVVRGVPGLADEKGFVPVRDTYQSAAYPDVYAVGVAAAVSVPWTTAVPVGVPKTGFPTEVQAHVAAENIASQIRGKEPGRHKAFGEIPAVCVMDAGNNGVMILADRMLPPRKAGVLIPGPQSHGAKLLFEKYFLWKARHGYVRLP